MPDQQETAIRATALKKRFGAIQALDQVSLEVPRGSVFCILGSNGAGKTTLIKILTTITAPDAGNVEILGLDIGKHPILVRHNLGIVSQDDHFETYFSIWDNLRLHAELHGLARPDYAPKIEALLKDVGLWERRYDTTDMLSGGMRRRVSLVRALIHDPKVLFLDEPTTGLDPVARRQIWDAIRQFSQNATVVLTTHYMEEADVLSDEILMLSHGRVVMTGSPRELKAKMSPQNRYELILKNPVAGEYAKRYETMLEAGYGSLRVVNDYRLELNLTKAEILPEVLGVVDPVDLVRFGELEADLEEVFISVAGGRAS